VIYRYLQTCQRAHTLLSYNVMINAKQLKINKGTPKVRISYPKCASSVHELTLPLQSYEDNSADSNKRIVRSFCGDCGTGLYSTPDSIPGKAFLKAGSLDDFDRVVLKSEIVSRTDTE
jgi:hypothetical protein